MKRAAAVALGAMLTACSAEPQQAVIFAAASLSQVGGQLEEAFEAQHPGTDITFSYAGSSELVRQLAAGAPADLLITADAPTMDRAALPSPQLVAHSRLVLALAPGNPAGITAPDAPRGRLAICADEVPCGKLTHAFAKAKGVDLSGASQEANAADVLTKVTAGTVDAGYIFEANAKEAGLEYMAIEDTEPNVYPAALTSRGAENDVALEFSAWLVSPEAQEIFANYGFEAAH